MAYCGDCEFYVDDSYRDCGADVDHFWHRDKYYCIAAVDRCYP